MNDFTNPMSPFNPLNPLSPLSPLSPFYEQPTHETTKQCTAEQCPPQKGDEALTSLLF